MIPDVKINLPGSVIVDALLAAEKSAGEKRNHQSEQARPNTIIDIQDKFIHENRLIQEPFQNQSDQFGVYIQMANAGQIQPAIRSETKKSALDEIEEVEQNERKYNWLPIALICVIAVLLLLIFLN